MKFKKWTAILGILSFLFIFGITKVDASETIAEKGAQISFSEYDQNISQTESINPAQLVSMVEGNKTFVLFVGFEKCPYCRGFSPVLKQFTDNSNVKIKYLDISKITAEQASNDFINVYSKILGIKIAPTILLIKHGKVIHSYVGSDTSLSQLNTLTKYKYND
ncbi:PedC/BrcD family bacteriocin maturation disulfide isomerase [Leuconostoc gasicomitatum]|uniref:PedC/BrcD family bacteriocin maturation disulfide isomerase n=1 Tax=Leuconostoc gasicomitatum TaxID=115778 RepID=UPI000BD62924|nr:PedC/BrcD family bacteriocin maturation disulfide isomerase [Leuconostoc gasicomitatum]MBZ5944966.1 PedC/BrcD family bacteriocin maturation disulfide isomerase [Leuconostoc gasicomitatum]MBZ5945773.1 PedC/BrcD family bacteriocin maturation disulfide isomerase [Leuconostoc gasicomitatum]MBZ5950071.1 PedC/BrcD family bacteriocin maturation disulfide isomerase [Leuconostoc gasicomitatum]MBZ5952242.1 PedC/BrcD family bacteriocin maturation disulfide isomerase [Leuconostoc gasicomitatum]MBZ59687